ncbi:MAG: TSUP family transporter [Methylobacteriaceae bacterium]|nr:TSUP family transporter [Methylobacteriaceae bacterium]
MPVLTPEIFLLLVCAALIAGFVDAIAGGGGLITVPALALAGLDPVAAVATNKVQSSFGSGSALIAFARAGYLDRSAWPIPIACIAGGIAGAALLTYIPRDAVQIALPAVLIGVALYFALSPAISDADAAPRMQRLAFICFVLPIIGAYDGVFGPGAGSFYMLAFITLLGFGINRATAHTKLANFASNIAGLATLAFSGHIYWTVGLAMSVAALAGATIGAYTTMRIGARIVRPMVITVCIALAIKLAWQHEVVRRMFGLH